MSDAAGHLAESAQTLLLHDRMLGLAKFVVGLLQVGMQARLVEQAAALRLCGKDLHLQSFFLRVDGLDLLEDLLVFIARFFQHQHDHAHGNEQLQNRRNENPGGGQAFIFLGKGIGRQINAPERKAKAEQTDSDELPAFTQAVKAQAGEHAGDADQQKDGKLDEQRIVQHLRADVTPDHEKEHEQSEESLARFDFQEVQAAPKQKDSGDSHAPLAHNL